MNDTRKPVYWGSEDCEQLSHEDMDPAIEEMLEVFPSPRELPSKVTICGYVPLVVVMPDMLEDLLERLQEEYGDPDGIWTDPVPTPAMIDAHEKFLAVIRAEYTPWACEEVERHEIDVPEWVRENRPDWLEVTE